MRSMSGSETTRERTEAGSPAPALPPPGTFGRIVLDLGLMTVEQLEEAIELQRKRSEGGDFARLGHILVERGYLTPGEVQRVLEAQKIVILTCVACSARYNIRDYSPRFHYECPRCHRELRAGEVESVAVEDQLQSSQSDDRAHLTRAEETNTAKIRMLKRLGKYEILGEIARGGMGIIYKARQPDLDRIVALKTLRQEEVDKSDAAEQFLAEAQAVALLRHPNIVGVHEVGEFRGIRYFTMDFIEGLPLDRILSREPLEPTRAVEVVTAIADAMHYAHRRGVVHRDLKPANIIVSTEDGIPFLVDFGIAKKIAVDGPRQLYDEEEDLLGSIPYMSPEYVEGAAYDELCDLYSLGVVLYEAVGGANALPYYDDDTRRFLEKIISIERKPITDWVPDLDPDLVEIVHRMVCPRDRRYPSMQAAGRALRRWLLSQDSAAVSGIAPAVLARIAAPLGETEEAAAASASAAAPTPDPEDDPEDDPERAPTPAAARAEASPQQAAAAAPPPRPAPGPEPLRRSPMVLALLLLASIGALAWTSHRVSGLEEELRGVRATEVETQAAQQALLAQRVAQARLEHARELVTLGQSERALALVDALLSGAPDPTEASLAPAYRLRGELRTTLGKPGAAADEQRAKALEQQGR